MKPHDLVDPNCMEIKEELVVKEDSSQRKVMTPADKTTRVDNVRISLVTRGRIGP